MEGPLAGVSKLHPRQEEGERAPQEARPLSKPKQEAVGLLSD